MNTRADQIEMTRVGRANMTRWRTLRDARRNLAEGVRLLWELGEADVEPICRRVHEQVERCDELLDQTRIWPDDDL